MLAETTLNTIGMIFQICDDKEETKNAIASILEKKKKVKKAKKTPIEQYISQKIRILKGFKIVLEPEQLEHIKTLPNEYAIDRYCRPIILGILN